ncbi:MAG: YitT family protein [Oscillospiraceae bacterium]
MSKITGKQVKETSLDILFDIVGCLLFAVGVQSFSAPNNLPPGGVTGVAVIINYLTGFPISWVSFAINIPILVLALIFLGKKFTLRTLKTVVILTLALEVCERIGAYQEDIMLAALIGGVLQGLGLGIVFWRGSTTGGVDIIGRLIQLKFPHLSLGRLMMLIDGLVLVATAVVYRNIGNALYALILIYACGRVIDAVIYGMDKGRVMMIISEKQEEIAALIHSELDRGATLLEGRGTYTDKARPVLFCAVRTQQFHQLKRLVYSIDPSAFLVALEADEIVGEGFKAPD